MYKQWNIFCCSIRDIKSFACVSKRWRKSCLYTSNVFVFSNKPTNYDKFYYLIKIDIHSCFLSFRNIVSVIGWKLQHRLKINLYSKISNVWYVNIYNLFFWSIYIFQHLSFSDNNANRFCNVESKSSEAHAWFA